MNNGGVTRAGGLICRMRSAACFTTSRNRHAICCILTEFIREALDVLGDQQSHHEVPEKASVRELLFETAEQDCGPQLWTNRSPSMSHRSRHPQITRLCFLVFDALHDRGECPTVASATSPGNSLSRDSLPCRVSVTNPLIVRASIAISVSRRSLHKQHLRVHQAESAPRTTQFLPSLARRVAQRISQSFQMQSSPSPNGFH
jgi:hypothetical protein